MHILSYQRSLKKQKKYSISREIEISNTAAIGDSGVEQFFSEIFGDKNDCIKYFLIIVIWNKWVDCFLVFCFLSGWLYSPFRGE